MTKKARFLRQISLAISAVALLVILGLPSSQAVVIVPANNDRCGPQGGDPGCDNVGALLVPQATTPGRQSRQCYEFDTTGITAGPMGVDVTGNPGPDVWFRMAGPHCAGKRVIMTASGSTGAVSGFLTTEGGGFPFFVCDTTCANVAGNPFFDQDFGGVPFGSAISFTVPISLAGRDFYFLTNIGASQVLRICFTTACL